MLGSRSADGEVTCVACGAAVARSAAREYDKHGDRWDRDGKEFEYLCKPCHRGLCHQPRDGLEALLVAVERSSDDVDRATFLSRYVALTEGESEESIEES